MEGNRNSSGSAMPGSAAGINSNSGQDIGGAARAVSAPGQQSRQNQNQNQNRHVPTAAANSRGSSSMSSSSSTAANATNITASANTNNASTAQSQPQLQMQPQQPKSPSHLQVGRMVNVLPRTWPGINKQGGTGRITAVHRNAGSSTTDSNAAHAQAQVTHVDVRYVVVGGRERRVPVEYVVAAPEYEQEYDDDDDDGNGNGGTAMGLPTTTTTAKNEGSMDVGGGRDAATTFSDASSAAAANIHTGRGMSAQSIMAAGGLPNRNRRRRHALRDRSMLLGRCGRCGSLRSDCGSCDWVALELEQQREQQRELERQEQALVEQQRERMEREEAGKRDMLLSDNSKKKKKRGRNYNRRRKQVASVGGGDDGGSSSDFSFDDNTSLSEIKARRERMYAKLLRETGWGNNGGGGDTFAKRRRRHRRRDRRDNEKKKVDGDGTKPQPIKRRRIIADDEDSSSSSSGSDEDGPHITPNAQKLSTSGQSFSSDESSSSSSSSSSDDMNDPILARLAQLRSVRNRGRGRDMSSPGSRSSSGKMARKRFMNRYTASRRTVSKSKRNARAKSSLEALPSPAGRTTSVATSTAPEPVAADVVDMSTEAGAERSSLPKSSEKNQQNNQQQPSARTGCVDDDDNIGEVEMTQGDFVLSGDDEEGDENDETPVAMDIDGGDPDEDDEQYSDREDNYSGARAAAIEDDDPLRLDSTFIQPEGQQAAQSLPEDTVDRTKGIEYLSLPAFFDNTADKIENETLPDARIHVEELGVAIRRVARRDVPTDEAKSPAELENDALLLFNDLRRTLIRDGTDQCRAALRRLTDGKERKRAKSRAKGKGTSSEEYRRFKRLNKCMDLRELRMDSLDESVEEVLRKCHALLDGFIANETNTGRLKPASGYLEGGSESSDEEGDEGHYSPRHNAQVDEEAGMDVGDAADLGEFDPHLHATLKRKKNKTRPRQQISATDEIKSKRKRSQSQSRNRANGGSSSGEGEIASRSAKVGKKRRTKPKTPPSLGSGSGDTQRIIGDIEVDDDFINNDVSDEETMPMEARPFDRDLDSRLSKRSRAKADANNAVSNRELRVSFLDDGGGFDSRNRAREMEATKSASERMQEFLDKNSTNTSLVDATIPSSQSRGERQRQRSAHSSEGHGEFNNRNRRSERDPSRHTRNEVSPMPSEALSAETLFDGLADLERRPPASSAATPRGAPAARENIPPAPSNIQSLSNSADLCDQLASAYQTSPRTATHLLMRLERSSFGAQSDVSSKTIDSLFKMVQQEGATSLIDIIANASSDQAKQLHLKLLTTVINFISSESSHAQENTSSSKLCEVVPRQKFVEEILLQIVDLLYAYFAPAAWANCIKGKISSSTLGALKELTESIGKNVPLVESVSRILVSCQRVQKWYRSGLSSSRDKGERFFVSSIDPAEYANFLKTGERRKIEQSELRFARFKMAIPRSEVHALWMIIAFFGNVHSNPAPSSQWYRYKHIVRRLFYSDASILSSGALLVQSQKVPLPPSKSHLSACEIELLRLSALIRSGALDPLPDQDGILTSLIQKSLSLQADSYRHDANAAAKDMMVATALSEVGTKVLLREIWESSDVASPANPLCDIESKILVQVGSEGNFSIQAGGGILRACISLMMAWMGRLPSDKKARWIRLRKDIDKLVASLSEKADAIGTSKDTQDSSADGVESAFEAAFGGGDIGASRNLQAGPVASATFYCQSASLILLTSTLSTLKTMHQPNESVQVFDEVLLKRIWIITSNDDMQKHQIYMQNGRRDQEPAVSSDFFRLIVATKVMSIFALLYLGADDSSDGASRTETGEVGLEFVLSCIVSSLESLCLAFMNEVKRNAEVALFPTAETSSGAFFRPTSTMCIAAISGGFAALSTILIRARANLTNSFFSSCSRSVLMGKKILSMIIPVTETAFACIIQTKEADSFSDIYLRTVLATMRHSIGLFHEARKSSDTATAAATPAAPSTDDTDAPPPNRANDADDMFGGLGDDAFMNIDLESLTGQSSCTPSSQMETSGTVVGEDDAEVDGLAKGKLWSLLIDALDAAKPSQRYAIDSRMPPNQSSNAPSTRGKALIATNAGAICASIAALTSLRKIGSVPFKSSFEDFFQGRRSAHHATDHQSRMGDLSYLKSLGQCFTLELCRYSRVSPACRGVVSSGLEMILGHFLEALVDPQTIHRLPSSNKAIISNSGGPKAQEMEVKYLKRMLRRSPSGSQEDDEATGARLLDNEAFDSPGPAFMASRIWSFARALGSIIVDLQPENQEILRIGKVLSGVDSDLADDATESCQRSLALVPLISMERECMKRIAMLRGIVSSLLSDDHIIGRIATNVVSLITKSVLQNIYYLSATVEYNEQRTRDWKDNPHADPEDLYERSRALALQHAYCEVASSYFAWLLNRGARSNNLHRIDPTVVVLKDVLLRTSLQKSSNTYCAALEAYNGKGRPPYVFDVLTSRGGSSSVNSRLADDLADGLGRRYHELVLYAADLFDLSGTTDVLSMLIESATAVPSGGANKKDKAILLGLALSGNHNEPFGSAIGQDDLQRATDSFFATVHTFQAFSVRERQLLGKLRRAALRNFIVPKLRFDAIEAGKKSNLLQILLSLVTANTDTVSSIVICPNEEGSGHLDLSDLCLIFRGLTHVLRECLAHSTDLSRDMILSIFQAAKLLIRLPISNATEGNNSESLLAWCDATSESIEGTTSPKTYISESTRWLNDIARLLARDACYQAITRIAVEARRTKNGHHSWDIDSLTDLDPPVECPGDDLAAIKSMLQLAQNLDTLDIEMYPDDRLQTPGQVAVKNIYAKRPAASTTMDEKAEASSAVVLGPRCKRTIKEYISEYLSLI